MSGMYSEEFAEKCSKAVLFVTCADEPGTVQVYFKPEDFDTARAAAPLDTEPDEVFIRDEMHDRDNAYAVVNYTMGEDEFEELETLVQMAKEGKITHIHGGKSYADAMPEVEHALRMQQVIHGVKGDEYTLALDHPDAAVPKEELPLVQIEGNVAATLQLTEKSQKYRN